MFNIIVSLLLFGVDSVSEGDGERPLAEWQVKELEGAFNASGYPDPPMLIKLARNLDLSESQIQVCVRVCGCACVWVRSQCYGISVS